MINVDPSALASAARRVTGAIGDLSAGGDPVHPPLGADPASVGAATRLSTAASTLSATLAAQAAGLAATAEQLVTVATGFAARDAANAAAIASLSSVGDGPAVSGWAPPSPPMPPDARPPLAPPPPMPGEALATAVHSGDITAGQSFVAAWAWVASTARGAAEVTRSAANNLPDGWESPVATDVVRAHLLRYAIALDESGSRASTLVRQASRHVEETSQARTDIPSPRRFAALRGQLERVAAANARTGGAYAVPLAALNEQRAEMDALAATGYGTYHAATDATTTGEVDLDGDGVPDPPADPTAVAAAAEESGEEPGLAGADGLPGVDRVPGADDPAAEGTPEGAGQLAAMLPGMIPMVLGVAGGLIGGAMSSIGKVPESLLQAGTQAAGAATQSLSGLMTPKLDDVSTESADLPLDDSLGSDLGGGAGAGGGETSPAGGGAPMPPVVPSTGPSPTPPTTPMGGTLPPPMEPASTRPIGGMPMAMPMGAMMPPTGGQGQCAQDQTGRPKKLTGSPIPHTESVTGKVSADRIAVSAAAPDRREPMPPANDDDPPQAAGPIIRRITTVAPRDET